GKAPGVLFMNENGVLTDRTSQLASASDVAGDQGLMQPANNRDVVVADFDNDGWPDFATAVTISDGDPKHISHPRIYMNQGAPGGSWLGFRFEAARSPQLYVLQANGQPDLNNPNPGRFCAIAAGDVDNDGDQDLYLGDYDGGLTPEPSSIDINDRLWINDGKGFFKDSWQSRMTSEMLLSAFSASAAIADLNGDGLMDVVKNTGLQAPQRVSASYNRNITPPGSCSEANPARCFDIFQVVSTQSPYFVSVGDLNNDARLDLVVTDDSNDHYHLNNGNDALGRVTWSTANFSFADAGDGDDGFGSQSLVADLDQDGFKEVLISDVDVDAPTGYATGAACAGGGQPGRRLHVYHNLANVPSVTLREEAQQSNGGGWRGLVGMTQSDLAGTYHTAAFDIDRDGDDDLVLGRTCSTSVWMNTSRTRYGQVAGNSTGAGARIWATGLMAVNATNLVLHASNVPPDAQGVFIVAGTKFDPCHAYDDGFLCVGAGPRFTVVGRARADAQGEASLSVDLTSPPLAGLPPGSIRYVQYRFADPKGGSAGFNFSDALELRFRP
ncbi:MAG TPA: VCBS repeat-containing protein, partial [Vicinamibacteria bacterium]|nr:VCBS repeat-containing protein [Vicinamibacteria bacterium]